MLNKEADRLKKLAKEKQSRKTESKLSWFDILAISAFCWVVSQFL